ncbi:MAG: AAA family ATPase [Deltaproteobacteria bacterium]|jgi:hypothetical protein|nr:AAA family ATPase [Deltaproteobacteria bacterium]
MSRHPASLQSFREIREEGLSYADKTEHVHRLLMDGRGFRLARPRAFGKTLLLSVMKALFRGRADLFEGLYLGSAGWTFESRPVIALDFARLEGGTPGALRDDLCWELKRVALKEGLSVKGASPGAVAAWLVEALHAKHGRRPAVLVDNASAPLERRLGDPAGLAAALAALSGFWEALASLGPRLRFVFAAGNLCFRGMTGPEGFLRDVTVGPRHAACCGITAQELDRVFRESLAEAAELRRADGAAGPPGGGGAGGLRGELLRRYGGYSWDAETRLLNPAAVISFLESAENSWHFLEERPPDLIPRACLAAAGRAAPPDPELTFTRGLLSALEPARPALAPLLFQAGALTLSGRRERDGVPEYSLGFPNAEVEEGFRMLALAALTGLDHATLRFHARRFRREAGEGRAQGAALALGGLLSAAGEAGLPGGGDRGDLYALFLRLAGFAAFPCRPEGACPDGGAGGASGALRLAGGRRVIATLRHLPGAEGLGEGAARRLLQEALEAALREHGEGGAPGDAAPPGAEAPSWEARRLFVFSAGSRETAGAAADAGSPLVFRPLARAGD